MTNVLCSTHPDLDVVEAYAQAFDDAWQAIEEAIAKLGIMNDVLYKGEALVQRAPLADVVLMREMAKKIKSELDCFEVAREPLNLSPILPGEVSCEQPLHNACLR
jgi:hypothetical protein